MAKKIYESQFLPTEEVIEAFKDFYAIVGQLRRDCPWDKEQTHESVKHMLIEESYEAVDAIDEEDWDELSRELGDVFLHVLFHSDIATASGTFGLLEVMQRETDKLVRRHPHVFGDVKVNSVEEVHQNWAKIKKQESQRATLDGIPRHLPALQRAYRIQEKAAGVGFDFENSEDTWKKVEEEVGELKSLIEAEGSAAEKEKEFGDVLFALVNYARFAGLQPENALRQTNAKFTQRFTHIEKRLDEQQKNWSDVDLDEMDVYWEEAKSME